MFDKQKSDHLSDYEIIEIKEYFINQFKSLNTTLKVVTAAVKNITGHYCDYQCWFGFDGNLSQ